MSEARSPGRPARRIRRTRASVRAAETVSRLCITVGGVGTILAVTLIFVFLVSVVVPLFFGSRFEARAAVPAEGLPGPGRVLHAAVDEYGLLGMVVEEPATLVVRDLSDGFEIERRELFEGAAPTCSSFGILEGQVGFGFESGQVILGRIHFRATSLTDGEITPELRALEVGGRTRFRDGVAERVSQDRWRVVAAAVELGDPIETRVGDAIRLLDQVQSERLTSMATLSASGELALREVRIKRNMLTGKVTLDTSTFPISFQPVPSRGEPKWLLLTDSRQSLFLCWEDGYLQRYDLRDLEEARLAETLNLLPDPESRVTSFGFLLGRTTLLCGDSEGGTSAWFEVHLADEVGGSELRLVRAHTFQGPDSAVRYVDSAEGSRTIAVAYSDGELRIYHVTTQELLVRAEADPGRGGVSAVALLPRGDGVVAFGERGIARWDFELHHPGANLTALFLPVWYESYPGPSLVWQSSSATDETEAKMSLTPLVFGTLKATFYSMIFGAPIALLAAIFCTEFLHARIRSSVKSLIEMMASLPSVVLGFVAALVIAPTVQDYLPSVLVSFVTLPLSFLLGAYLFQLVPSSISLRLLGWPRFVLICFTLPVGILLARLFGPLAERWLFAGSLEGWLNGNVQGSTGGWTMLLLPVAAVAVLVLMGRYVTPWLRDRSFHWGRGQCAAADVTRYACGVAATLGLALLVATALDATGLDPRGGPVGFGRYEQRNALVVGFVMGFAIIPIVFTLAEDALSSVPTHLREASLGAGATVWQTAVRVIVPTASSGLYSAVMIGLGRAVGETMIVLMAVGNTPIMNWNVFNGFRTLSANIATELPEAAVGDTHYRVLFLAALLLFAMTFLLNTVAEVVRQRSRRRAQQL